MDFMAQLLLSCIPLGQGNTSSILSHFSAALELSTILKLNSLFILQLHTLTKAKYNKCMWGWRVGRLLHLNNGEIVALCLSNVGYIVLELEAWQVVIDVLQD